MACGGAAGPSAGFVGASRRPVFPGPAFRALGEEGRGPAPPAAEAGKPRFPRKAASPPLASSVLSGLPCWEGRARFGAVGAKQTPSDDSTYLNDAAFLLPAFHPRQRR
ncbi:hypothetical protein LSM04_008431 [Trypanosoma melophagium]|uniref:uncharacterized protein n=1 Tax=Trypanosoma melophagium TaxID=715481 RepID=UPI00351A38CA|nr:hypothetical protein LSM04_008431 [Trypanosoma melophagium]